MTDYLSQPDAIAIAREAVNQAGGVNAFARKVGINQATVSQALNGRIAFPISMANAVGLIEMPRQYMRVRESK